jgi:hypothetical protein
LFLWPSHSCLFSPKNISNNDCRTSIDMKSHIYREDRTWYTFTFSVTGLMAESASSRIFRELERRILFV